MTSLTWNYKTSLNLIACGIDAERVERFNSIVNSDKYPMPFIFSKEEIKHINQLSAPAKGFCAAFCSKEAFYKAISAHYNFCDCELFLSETDPWQTLIINDNLCKQFGIDKAKARVEFFNHADYTECLASVYLYKSIQS